MADSGSVRAGGDEEEVSISWWMAGWECGRMSRGVERSVGVSAGCMRGEVGSVGVEVW